MREHMDAIRMALDGLIAVLNWNRSSRDWTPRVKGELCTVGHEFGFRVRATVPEPWADLCERGEWLFDVVWITDDYRMTLAAECEFDPQWNAVEEDFGKLLVARADLCLMIISGQDGWNDNLQKMADQMNACPMVRSDDMYLIAVPVEDSEGRTWRFRWFKSSQEGLMEWDKK